MSASRPPSTAQEVPASASGFRPYTLPPPARARQNVSPATPQGTSSNSNVIQFPSRTRPTTPPANSIQPRIPNSVINRVVPQGVKNSIGGIVPSLVPAAKDFVDREFDRRFPSLAPVRQAADLANPLTLPRSLADHPLNPLNPFGRLWDWAPWNDKSNPKGLNTPRSAPEPLWPPGTNPNPGNYKLPGTDEPGKGYKARVYSTNNFNFVAWDRLVSFQFQIIGGSFIANMSGTFWRSIPGGFQLDNFFINADPATFSLLGENNAPIAGLEPEPGTGRPWPSPQTGMDPIEIFPPLPSPQHEPIGNPSYPRNPQPDTHPSQTPKPTAPNTAPKPAPLPQPNIPQPFPFPIPIPVPNIPNTQPFPDGIPRPDPKTGTPPNPAPMPGRIPHIQQRLEPGWNPQTNPTPQQFPNTPWKEPEIVKQNSPLIKKPSSQTQPDPTARDLQEQIKDVKKGVEESTQKSCRYAEDDLAIANVTRLTGINPLTNTPQFSVVPIQVHEKLKDYIEIQSETLAKIQGQTDGLRGRIKSVLDRLQVVRILNIMSTIASLHNAAMLSRNLAQTLGDATSTMITAIGRITGVMSPEESIDVNQLIGEAFNDFMKSALGEDVWNGTKENWTKANRILTSASQIVWTIRNIGDSARAIGEWTAENTGKIGNALKKWGVVGERAYPYMAENVTARTAFQKRLDDFRAGVDNLEDAASSLQSVAGESISIMDEAQQLKTQWDEFGNHVKAAEPKQRDDNNPVKNSVTASKTASEAKDVVSSDLEKADEPT